MPDVLDYAPPRDPAKLPGEFRQFALGIVVLALALLLVTAVALAAALLAPLLRSA